MESIVERKMGNFIESVEKSLSTNNFHAALSIALMLPDICGTLETPEKCHRQIYIDWYNRYLKMKYVDYLTGLDFYAIRCAYLHQGFDEVDSQKSKDIIDKFQFISSGSHCALLQNNTYDNVKQKTQLILNPTKFSNDIIQGTNSWISEHKTDSTINKRAEGIMEILPFYNDGYIKIG